MQSYQHPGPLALAKRQLADWQHLFTELEAIPAPPEQLAYCQAQIERLEKEIKALTE